MIVHNKMENKMTAVFLDYLFYQLKRSNVRITVNYIQGERIK